MFQSLNEEGRTCHFDEVNLLIWEMKTKMKQGIELKVYELGVFRTERDIFIFLLTPPPPHQL